MIQWKPQPAQYGGGDSTFGAEFAKGEPGIAKQLCNASGAFEDKRTVTVNGYSYKVKIVPKKDGTGNWIFIERKQTFVGLGDEKPEQIAHKQTLKEYPNAEPHYDQRVESPKGDWSAKTTNGFDQRSADIKKLHDENVAASMNLAAAILALANEVQGIKHLLEIVVNNGDIVKKTFKTASELTKGLSASG